MDLFTNFFIGILAAIFITTATDGCSVPDGGYVEPTAAEIYHYSRHVVVGTVLSLITPDPVFGDMYGDSTYGARVKVRCAYKGGPVDPSITIHGAGFVPGLCEAKPLEVGKEVILFLDDVREPEMTYFQQYPAENYTSAIETYRSVCDITVTYTAENKPAITGRTISKDAGDGYASGTAPNTGASGTGASGNSGNSAEITTWSSVMLLFSVVAMLIHQ